MLDGFVHNYADAVNRLNELEGLEDKTALAAYLHTLAGVSGNMGAMALFEVALDISQRLRSRGSMTMLDEDEATGLARIKTIMPRLLNVLQKLSFPDKDQQPQSLEFDAMAEWVALQKEVGASDPGAADRCRTLLGRTRLSARNREALERVLVELDGFEFAEAEQIIKTISCI